MQHSLAGCRARDIKRISELNSTQQPGLLTHGRLGGYFTREVEGTGAKSKHGYRPVDWDFLPVHPLVQHTTGWLDDFRLSWGTEKKNTNHAPKWSWYEVSVDLDLNGLELTPAYGQETQAIRTAKEGLQLD